jgi:hypothetical protein
MLEEFGLSNELVADIGSNDEMILCRISGSCRGYEAFCHVGYNDI